MDDPETKGGLHSEKPVTKPPASWHGQTYNLFISKMKVTIKTDKESKAFEVCHPRCVNKLNRGCTVKHNCVCSKRMYILELKSKSEQYVP